MIGACCEQPLIVRMPTLTRTDKLRMELPNAAAWDGSEAQRMQSRSGPRPGRARSSRAHVQREPGHNSPTAEELEASAPLPRRRLSYLIRSLYAGYLSACSFNRSLSKPIMFVNCSPVNDTTEQPLPVALTVAFLGSDVRRAISPK